LRYDDGLRTYKTKKPFEGVIPNIERRWKETDSAWVREEMERFQSAGALRGLQRLPPEARGAGGQDRGLHIGEVSSLDRAAGEVVRRCPRSSRPSRTRSPRAS
jgi:excinuclease ABC subunit A